MHDGADNKALGNNQLKGNFNIHCESVQASHPGAVSQKCDLDRHRHHEFSLFPDSDLVDSVQVFTLKRPLPSNQIKQKLNRHRHHGRGGGNSDCIHLNAGGWRQPGSR